MGKYTNLLDDCNRSAFLSALDADIEEEEARIDETPNTPLKEFVHTFEDVYDELSMNDILSFCENNR